MMMYWKAMDMFSSELQFKTKWYKGLMGCLKEVWNPTKMEDSLIADDLIHLL